MSFELLNPAGLEKPIGYAHVAKITSGKLVYVAGQAPFNADGDVVGKGDFVAQFRQVMHNLKLAIEGAGGRPNQFAVLTMYVTDVQAYLANKKPLGTAYTVWTGIGAVGAFVVGVAVLGEPLGAGRVAAALLIVTGLVLMKIYTPA